MQVGSNIAHQSENNAIFFMMPVQYSSLATNRYIALVRRIEDRLLHYGMDISREVSIHFVVQDLHATCDKSVAVVVCASVPPMFPHAHGRKAMSSSICRMYLY